MRINSINPVQYNNSHQNRVAFKGFWRDLKNIAGSALDTGVNYITGQTNAPEKEFIDQMSIRETGYRVGEKERLEKEIAEKEQRLREERKRAEQIENERKSLEKENYLRQLLKPYIETLENDFFSVIEASKKDSNIIPPNGILIETPGLFTQEPVPKPERYPRLLNTLKVFDEANNEITRYFIAHGVMPRFIQMARMTAEINDRYIEEYHASVQRYQNYNNEKREYEERILVQQKLEQYLRNKQDINKFLIQTESLSHVGSALECAQKAYNENGKHALIWVENFDKIGTPLEENKRCIAALKNILCSCAEKFHATCLINIAKDKIQSIDPILLVDSRMPIKIRL